MSVYIQLGCRSLRRLERIIAGRTGENMDPIIICHETRPILIEIAEFHDHPPNYGFRKRVVDFASPHARNTGGRKFRGSVRPYHVVSLIGLLCILAEQVCTAGNPTEALDGLAKARDYVARRASSYDHTGANRDYVEIAPGQVLTLLDTTGPAVISHIWVTIASSDDHHLKALVLRAYWDGEGSPSVEAPIGDFFGLGLGDYFSYQSKVLSVGSDKALNCFFPMPFQRRARITVTNEGAKKVDSFYFNIDYRFYRTSLPENLLYFHAQYRQATPAKGWTAEWQSNDDALVDDAKNPDGKGNYVWMEAKGRGHFVGVAMSVLQNQDDWWGEGDDMFFIDGEATPSINGTGSEDYFLGAWDFRGHPFSYETYGAAVTGPERAGSRSSVYRFHLDSPITFTKSLRATIEHGNANHRSDNFFSVAYWYQSEPHDPFPTLPSLSLRIPRLYPTGGPGNAGR